MAVAVVTLPIMPDRAATHAACAAANALFSANLLEIPAANEAIPAVALRAEILVTTALKSDIAAVEIRCAIRKTCPEKAAVVAPWDLPADREIIPVSAA